MQLCHAFVVAPEKRAEILCQVFLVNLGERANNAEVQRDITAKSLGLQADLNVARMHVAMEEPITKHLGKKYRHAIACEFFHVDTGIAQTLGLADGHALHALHHHHVGHAVVPDHLRDHHQIKTGHIAPQLGSACGFTHQVEFVVQILVKLAHHLARLEALAVSRRAFHPACHHVHQGQVFFNGRQHVGAQYLDGDFTAIGQHGEVNLRNRCAGDRRMVKAGKDFLQRAAK